MISAQQIIDSKAYKKAVEMVDKDLWTEWKQEEDRDKRDELWRQLNATERLTLKLRVLADREKQQQRG